MGGRGAIQQPKRSGDELGMKMFPPDDDILSFLFQNAGEGPTGHVQKGAAADRLYSVSLGTADRCIIAQKPHR